MVVALVLLAIAMIAGGSMAAAFGWDIVLLERGWVMVIAGSAVAASGALILAVAAVLARLGRIRGDLADLSERLSRRDLPLAAEAPVPPVLSPVAPVAAAPGDRKDGPVTGEEPPLPLFMQAPREDEKGELPPGLVADSIETVIDAQRDREEGKPAPSLTLVESDTGPEKPEPAAVVPLFPERKIEPRPEPEKEVPDTDEEEPKTERKDDADEAAKPSVEKAETEDEVSSARAPAPMPTGDAETPSDNAIIGSYTSGENRYVMFADGSISAHTPTGVFRFASLDELKEFIAAGGEGASHG